MSKHNHNASVTGLKGENLMKELLNKRGLSILKTMSDFQEYYKIDKKEARKLYNKYVRLPTCGYTGECFLSDGYIPELGYIVEIKYGEKHGTTEEKVHFDALKIKSGVYKAAPLAYFFFGTTEKSRNGKETGRNHSMDFRLTCELLGVEVGAGKDLEIVLVQTNNGLDKWIDEKIENKKGV